MYDKCWPVKKKERRCLSSATQTPAPAPMLRENSARSLRPVTTPRRQLVTPGCGKTFGANAPDSLPAAASRGEVRSERNAVRPRTLPEQILDERPPTGRRDYFEGRRGLTSAA